MVLGRCLNAASTAQKMKNADVIPYRDSKLTMLLLAALVGKEKMAMIVTVTPVDKYYEENLNVLNFASIAKNIVFKEPVIKQHRISYAGFMEFSKMAADEGGNEYPKELEDEIVYLRLEVERLKHDHELQMQLLEEKLRKELTEIYQEIIQNNKKQHEDECEKKLLIAGRKADFKLSAQKRRYEEQIEDLKDEIEELKNSNSGSHKSGYPPAGNPAARARILEALTNLPTPPNVAVADLAITVGIASSQEKIPDMGYAAAFGKNSRMVRSPPPAPLPATERSGSGDPPDTADSAKRGRDPASPASGLSGTLPKRSKAAQEKPKSDAEDEEEEELKLTRAECDAKLGILLGPPRKLCN
ncbi:hypothetical protein KR059_011104 [Drosophila kikkawai]|nr:hypothetical protein KR059_011104 [Drosophila kikkawai]